MVLMCAHGRAVGQCVEHTPCSPVGAWCAHAAPGKKLVPWELRPVCACVGHGLHRTKTTRMQATTSPHDVPLKPLPLRCCSHDHFPGCP